MPGTEETQEQLFINEQYLTVKKIGQGGFGVVWKAYDFSLRNFVAVKELLKEYADRKFVEMFYREALIAKNIIHDNIVRVQHFWKGSDGGFYLLMDYVSGSDLENMIRKCNMKNIRLPWELAVLITSGILKAIDHANRLAKDPITGKPYGIVYRDISPGNVLISFEGNVKLSDFGIAKTADELNNGIRQRIITGKYAYMSPEQIRADADIDHRSDIYSIGIVLYEMLSGLQLYGGDNSVIKQHVLNTEFDPALLGGLGLPEELIDVVGKALQKNKEDRYEKALEMFRDLRRLLRGKETEELTAELAEFAGKILADEIRAENASKDATQGTTIEDVKNRPGVRKIVCRDFIVGAPQDIPEPDEGTPADKPEPAAMAAPAGEPPASVQPPAAPDTVTRPAADVLPAVAPQPAAPAAAAAPEQPAEKKPDDTAALPAAATPDAPKMPSVVEEIIKKQDTGDLARRIREKLSLAPKKTEPPKTVPQAVSGSSSAKPVPPKKVDTPAKRPVEQKKKPEKPVPVTPRAEQANVEEKGKTVFEEVGDWLVTKYRTYKKRIISAAIALVAASAIFVVIDIFTQITPFGKDMYSKIYPPDVVITTVPSGALVNIADREGKVILSNSDSTYPIELRKIPPKSYIVTATKDGFKPLERIVRIEEPSKGGAGSGQQKIELFFDFTLSIVSEPPGAAVYIDGNKSSKQTPWKGDLTSGEHTVKLALEGYDDLGSQAKEAKEGQCNIDFTRSSLAEIFNGVDSKYWTYEMLTQNGETVFNLTGTLFKQVSFKTSPKNVILHIFNESKPRGTTPLQVALKAGEHKIRFADPDGRYEETTRIIPVTSDSSRDVTVHLNKWVVFKAHFKDDPARPLNARVRITGPSVAVTRDISNGKPVRLALPVAVYRVEFEGGEEVKPLVKKVDISGQDSVTGEVEYRNSTLKVVVKDGVTDLPVGDAFVWIQEVLAGRTDRAGTWENTVKFGTSTIRVIATGYLDQSFERRFSPGRHEELNVVLMPEQMVAVSTPTVTAPQKPVVEPIAPRRQTKPVEPKPGDVKKTGTGTSISDLIRKNPPEAATTGTITCQYCKKEFNIGPKKLRFCTNCGKPFK